ncbi:MAG: hypothetical protein ACR2PF_01790 [Rhizobiaceae bacterium]
MLLEQTENLEELILAEKERVAQELIEEAWANAVQEGIEPAILAEQAITFALTQLGLTGGEEAVREIVDSLPDRVASGHFLAQRVLQ